MEPSDQGRRRRRRSGSTASGSGRQQRENNRRFGLMLFAVMVLIAVAAAVTQFSALTREAPGYGSFLFGMTRADVQALGAVPAPSGAGLISAHEGSAYTLMLDAAGRLAGVTCRESGEPVRRCDSAYGVRIGTAEADLHRLLGRPDSRLAAPDGLWLDYTAPGLRLRLQDGDVVQIERRPVGTRPGLLHLAALRALP